MPGEFSTMTNKIEVVDKAPEEFDEEKQILRTQVGDRWRSLETVEAELAKTVDERDVEH